MSQLATQPIDYEKVRAEIDLHRIFRDYVKHEDDLINQRLNWNFYIQGFLLGAFAFAFQKTAELWNALSHVNDTPQLDFSPVRHGLGELYVFLLVVAVVGIWVSLVVLQCSCRDIGAHRTGASMAHSSSGIQIQ
jgi:hypothetical protein